MTPNSTPVTPGTYDVGGVTITTEANTYDVGTGQLAAVLALGSAALDGKTVKITAGADAGGASIGDTTSFGTGLVLPTGLLITSRDLSDIGYLRRLEFKHNGLVWLDDVIIRDFWHLGDSQHTAVIQHATNSGATNVGKVKITNSEIYSDTITSADLNPSTVTSVVAGQYYQIETVTGADWTSVGGPASATPLQDFFATSSGSLSGLGTARPFPHTLRLQFDAALGPNQTRELEMTDCYIHHGEHGLSGAFTSTRVERCKFSYLYGDKSQMGVRGTETLFIFKDCWFESDIGNAINPFDVHVDNLQVNLVGMTQANTEAYQVIGCRFFTRIGELGGQGIFFEDFNASKYPVKVDFRHNMIMTDYANGIVLETGSADSFMRWNTLVTDLDLTGYPPQIVIAEEVGGVAVRENAHGGMTLTEPLTLAKMVNNVEFATDDNTGYSAALVGTDFRHSAFATLAEFTAAMMPKVGGPLDVAYGPKVGAGWYYEYDAIPAGPRSKSGLGTGVASEPAVVVPDAFVTGQWSATIGNAKITISVDALPLDGGAYPTAIQYSTNGGTDYTNSGNAGLGVFDITGLTNGVEYDVRLRAVNSAGNGAGSDTKARTPLNTYSINATKFESSAYISMTSGFNAPGSKKFLLSANFFFPAAWPLGGALLHTKNAGGNSRVKLGFTSSNRLALEVYNAAGATVAYTVCNASEFAIDTWYTIAYSMDTTTGVVRLQAKKRPDGGSWSDISGTKTIYITDGIVEDCTRVMVGDGPVNGYYADVYLHTTEELDLSNSTLLDRLLPSESKGANGSTVTGTQPQLFLSNPFGSFETNLGSGGGLTGKSGTFSAAPSVPT